MSKSTCPNHTVRVLVVDPQGSLKEALEAATRGPRCHVVHAKSYVEAWMLLHQAQFDLAFVNEAPGSECWKELVAEIRSMQLAVPVILTAAAADERFCVDALFSGAYDVLRMPLDAAEARRIVQQVTCPAKPGAGRKPAVRRHVARSSASLNL